MGDALPIMVAVEQELRSAAMGDDEIVAAVRAGCARPEVRARIGAGKSVAIAAGSRGIANIAAVVGAIVAEVKRAGGAPFVFPAMGSHGGGTADGQRAVLASLGIDEATMGCPIRATMDTVVLGETERGLPVHFDRFAAAADAVIVANRVKPHTNFRAHVESGLTKMLVVGCGKHAQALALHRRGHAGFVEHMPAAARVVLAKAPIACGFAILEDGHHRTSRVECVLPGEIAAREPQLLAEARATLPRLPVDRLDLLIVERMGKDVSGTGMDTNVVGRCRLLDLDAFPSPRITVIVALDLTEDTHGNATGVGLADLITERLAAKVDWAATYVNCVTSMCPQLAAKPMTVATDRDAVRMALDHFLGPDAVGRARIARIRDTLSLARFEVSEAVAEEIAGKPGIRVGRRAPMRFDADGRLV